MHNLRHAGVFRTTEHDRHEMCLISSFTAANLIKSLGCSRYATLCGGQCKLRTLKLFRKVISSQCGAALNTEKTSSAACAVCSHTFVWWRTSDARPHLRLRARRVRTAAALGAARGEHKGTPLTSGAGARRGSRPRVYKWGADEGAAVSQPSIRPGEGGDISCHASLRAPPAPSGSPRSLLRLLHPELPPRREASAAGDRDQTG